MTRQRIKAAPLKRIVTDLRDDRLFFIGCDDRYAPDQYFGFFHIPRIKVKVVPASDDRSHAKWVLDKLLECEVEDDDERWMILDTDHCTTPQHFHSYETAISEARALGIGIAISKPSFEVWLALHHVDAAELDDCPDADAVGDLLRNRLGVYNKTNLREEDFPIARVSVAYERAKLRDSVVTGGDNPCAVTTRVYKIWQRILIKAQMSQLVSPLRDLAMAIRAEFNGME